MPNFTPTRGRFQAPDIRNPQPFRPSPVNSSTYVRPAIPSGAGSSAARLADSLGFLNSSLVNYGTSAEIARQTAPAPSRWTGMSTDQIRAEVAKGGDEVSSDAAQSMYGARVVGDFSRDLASKMETDLDKIGGDYEGFARGLASDYMKGLSPAAANAFAKLAEPYIQKGHAAWTKYQTERTVQTMEEGASVQYQTIIDTAEKAGKKPGEIASEVWMAHKANVAHLHLDPVAAEKVVYELAKQYAEKGEVEMFDALVNDDRGGIGPLSKKAGNLVEVENLRKQALATRAKAQAGVAAAQAENAYFKQGVELARSGRFHELGEQEIPNGTGGTRTIKPQEVADRMVKNIRASVEAGVLDEATAEKQTAEFFEVTGLQNPEWKQALNVGASISSSQVIASKGGPGKPDAELPPAAVDGFRIYKMLDANSPSVLARQGMTEDASKFWERAARIQEVEGIGDEQALIEARRRLGEEARNGIRIDLNIHDDELLGSLRKHRDGFGPWSYPEDNLTALIPVVRERVNEGLRDGLSRGKAIDSALGWVDKNYVAVNGSLVRITDEVPTDFAEMVEGMLRQYAEAYGKNEGIDSWKDLTIRQSPGESRWLIYNKAARSWARSGDPDERAFTPKGMQQFRVYQARQKHDLDKLIEEEASKSADPTLRRIGLRAEHSIRQFFGLEDELPGTDRPEFAPR